MPHTRQCESVLFQEWAGVERGNHGKESFKSPCAEGRELQQEARGPRYGLRHGQDLDSRSQGPGLALGSSLMRGFEGGQMPLHRRLPKRGFTNIFRTEYT